MMERRITALLLVLIAALLLASAAQADVLQRDKQWNGHGSKSPDLRSQNAKLLGTAPNPFEINSDLAFWGDLAFAGDFGGFRVIDISAPANPKVVADVDCVGPQNDVSVWGNLLFLSVDAVMTGSGCDSDFAEDPTAPGGWEGIRIFDVSNPADPRFVTGVETDCGSHTNTLIPDPANGRVLLYVLSYALTSGPHCGPEAFAAGRADSPLHEKFSIVEVPLSAPGDAAVIAEPGIAAPLFDLGFPGLNPTIGCHDATVFLELRLAAVACLSDAQLWDITDPENPASMAAIHISNPDVEIWHSAAFTWDGKVIVFGDESESGSCSSPSERDGRLWFYSRANPPSVLGSFMIPRPQPAIEYCSVHLFNVIPGVRGYLLASSWYEGGTDIVDFTDPANAREVGYYDAQAPIPSVVWSAYWYNGFVYANDIIRGFDVFRFSDSALAGGSRVPYLNPQTQSSLIR